jgi:hypothetical protein
MVTSPKKKCQLCNECLFSGSGVLEYSFSQWDHKCGVFDDPREVACFKVYGFPPKDHKSVVSDHHKNSVPEV